MFPETRVSFLFTVSQLHCSQTFTLFVLRSSILRSTKENYDSKRSGHVVLKRKLSTTIRALQISKNGLTAF